MSAMSHRKPNPATIPTCSSCGGEIPEKGSEAWESGEDECPGSVTERGRCGAFDDDLDGQAWTGDRVEALMSESTDDELHQDHDEAVDLAYECEIDGDDWHAIRFRERGYDDEAATPAADARLPDFDGEPWVLSRRPAGDDETEWEVEGEYATLTACCEAVAASYCPR